MILGIQVGSLIEIDHKDNNGLNNRRSNLRIATRHQNFGNRRSFKGKSQYKGVYPHSTNKKWIAQIGYNYKKYNLGSFDSEEDAARAYDEAAKKLYGEFARLNL